MNPWVANLQILKVLLIYFFPRERFIFLSHVQGGCPIYFYISWSRIITSSVGSAWLNFIPKHRGHGQLGASALREGWAALFVHRHGAAQLRNGGADTLAMKNTMVDECWRVISKFIGNYNILYIYIYIYYNNPRTRYYNDYPCWLGMMTYKP